MRVELCRYIGMVFVRFFRKFLVTWGFRIGIAGFAGLGILAYKSLTNTIQRNQAVNKTNNVLNQVSQIQVLMEKAEASERGYLITGKPIFLQAFVDAVVAIPNQVMALLNLVEDNPIQVSNGIELRRVIEQRIEKMKTMVNMRQAGTPVEQIGQTLDVDVITDVRSKLNDMEALEKSYMVDRLQQSSSQSRQTKALLLFGSLLAAILLLASRRLQLLHEEKELAKTNLLNMIVNSVGDALVVVDHGNNITHYNPAAEKILGPKFIGEPQLRPQTYGFYHVKNSQLLKPEELPLARALKGETSDDFEVLIKNKTQPKGMVVSINTRPLLGSNRKVLGAVAVLRDFTERKKAEMQMEAQKETALEASRLKSEALASLSHEIRTPMNGVLGMTTLLLDTKMTEVQQSYARTIKGSAEALLTLINGILDHAKIEAGKLTLDNFDFNLPTLVGDVAEMFTYMARSKSLELVQEISPEAAEWFNGDGHRIRQILTNLVGNAFKFTEKGKIAIKVTARTVSPMDRELRFEVTDTGIGISPANQQKLFQKFAQVHSDKTKYGGSGLGLMLCKQFVQLMNGKIGIESREGQGSTFWFTVKVSPGIHQQKPRDLEYPVSTLSGHVLVVEDQPVNRQVVKSFLEKFGVTCDIQNNGVEGLGAYRSSPDKYDLVLMDCQMPLMDGYQCSQEIRRFEQENTRNPVPIIALTAEGRQGDRDKCTAAGMDDFLAKPLDLIQFYDVLKKWLRPKAKVSTDLVEWSVLERLTSMKADGRPLDMALVEEFLNTSGPLVDSLEDAMRRNDKAQIKEFAHALKSPARTVGLLALGDLCESIEAADGEHVNTGKLGDLHDRSVKELRNYLRRRSTQAS